MEKIKESIIFFITSLAATILLILFSYVIAIYDLVPIVINQ